MMGTKRSRTRSERRSRSVDRVKTPVPTTLRAFDPLVRPNGSTAAQLLRTVVMLAAAIGLHAFMLTAIFAANRVAMTMEPKSLRDDKINVAIVEPPPPPPPPVEPPPPIEEEPTPEEAEPPPPPPPKKKPPKKKEPPKKEPPPPDPIDLPPDPPKEPPKKQPRRIAGLNLESTVNGGKGASFGIGNTRMGRTGDVAEDAKKIRKLDKTAPPPKTNRAASRIPGRGKGKVVPPKVSGRTIKPDYPPLLKKQGIEAVVTVEVRIDKAGKVTSARVLEGPRFKEFWRAALVAARKQTWTAATQGGRPIVYTKTYNYRFRITD